MKARNPGFTLIELLVVMMLGSLTLAAVYKTITTQERALRQEQAIISIQQNNRIANDVIAADLREVSATGSDVLFASDTAIEFRALRKAGIACVIASSSIDVAELGAPFAADDSIYYFMDGPDQNAADDDAWAKARVNSVSTGSCTGSPYGATTTRLNLGSAVTTSSTYPGAIVRSFLVTRYALRQDGDEWWLSRQEAGGTPVSLVGPLAEPEQEGLRFRYFDSDGNVMPLTSINSNLQSIRSIEIKTAAREIGGPSAAQRVQLDSLVTRVFLRGNS